MNQEKVLNKIKKDLKHNSMRYVAKNIGVKSHVTIHNWLRKNTTSDQTFEKAKSYYDKN